MAEWWKNYPWRVIQTNMRECDMKDLDAVRFVEDLKSFHANAVMVSFGGTLANYESKVPSHYINPELTGDSLKTLVDLCHANGIKVIARTDFSKMHASVFAAHPDWAYRDPEGNPLESFGYYSTCQNGGFQQDFMDAVITEIIQDFHVDGIYCNMSSFMVVDYFTNLHGPCHCENCQRVFRQMSGMEIPSKDVPFASPKDPAVGAYQKFKAMVTGAQKKRVEKLIHSLDPNVAYCSVDYIRQESNTEIGKNRPPFVYSAASNTRAMNGTGKPATSASVDMMAFSARYASVSPALHEYRLWQAMANFGGIDFFLMGRIDNRTDKSGYERVRNIFSHAARYEKEYLGLKSEASVLLVRDSYTVPNPEERGWVRFLTESHIPFDETLTASFQTMDFSRYELIVLPEKNRLTPETCACLDAYVENGGKLLVIGKTMPSIQSLGLSEVGGFVQADGASVLLGEEGARLLPSLEGRTLIPMGKGYYDVKTKEAKAVMTLMPPQRFGPPEVCYCAETPLENPAFTVNGYGKGLAVYVAWQLGTIYHNEGYDVWFLTAKDLFTKLLGVKSVAEDLSPMVEVTVGGKDGRKMVQLVNGTGHFGNSYFDPVPLKDVQVEIPYEGGEVTCRSLYVQDNVVVEKTEHTLKLKVKELGFYEAIEITKA